MGSNSLLRIKLFCLSLVISIFLVSCDLEDSLILREGSIQNIPGALFIKNALRNQNSTGGQAKAGLQVDNLFFDFYISLGGDDILGNAISPVEQADGKIQQYLETGLMVFEPRAVASQRFQLAPIGLDLTISAAESKTSTDKSGRMVNGKFVFPEFLDMYERLGGVRYVGKPITEARYNADKKRTEQYFENLGFYKLDNETKVRLLPYGMYVCNLDCRDTAQSSAIYAKRPILPDPFLKKTLELSLEFVGKPLTGLHIASDGMQEVIFENLVLVADSDSPEEVVIRPLAAKFGRFSQDLNSPQDSALSKFIEIQNGKGFNVPVFFFDYLNNMGGLQVVGQPISEVSYAGDGVYWQCFTTLCLQFAINETDEHRFSLMPLGMEYKSKVYDRSMDFKANHSLEKVEVKIWETNTFVSADEEQEINVVLYEDGKPLENCEPILIVTMPDGSQKKSYFQPSNRDGFTSLRLPPIKAPNGTLIAYQICLIDLDGEVHCEGDNYLIWDSD